MTRRLCLLLLGAGLCAPTLPACAPTTHSLLKCTCWENEQGGNGPGSHGSGRVQPGPYLGVEEAELAAPPRPEEVSGSPYPSRQHALTASGKQRPVLPPGQNVAETWDPPPVRPPLELPPRAFGEQSSQAQEPNAGAPPVVHIAEASPPSEEGLVAALKSLLNKQPADAAKHLDRYDRTTQDFFMRLLPLVALLNEKSVDQLSPTEVGGLEEQVQGVLAALRSRTELIIDKMCLFDGIDHRHGQVTPKRDGYAFQPRTSRQAGELVQVYVELRNLSCELRDNSYVTILNGTVKILDGQNKIVWSHNYRLREVPLSNRMPRYDCCRVYDFPVPMMPPGKYTLSIEILDVTRQPFRSAQRSVEFNVAPPANQ
jgi:hypothetical protein